MYIQPSSLHEIIEVVSDVSFNLIIIFVLVWLYRKGHLRRIWNDINEFSIFGASIKKRSTQEAKNLDDTNMPSESDETSSDVVIWATSGQRPTATMSALMDKGYSIYEIDPLSPDALTKFSDIFSRNDELVVVTNLKHGPSYLGGLDFSQLVKNKYPKAHIVIFTSMTAKNRRRKHIKEKIDTPYVATNEPELDEIFQKIFK